MIIMETWRILFCAVFVLVGIAVGVIAILSAFCKGPLLSHAWTLASPEEREKIDKKEEYHGIAVVFGGLSIALILLGVHILTEIEILFWLGMLAAVAAVFLGMGGGWKRFRKEHPDDTLF